MMIVYQGTSPFIISSTFLRHRNTCEAKMHRGQMPGSQSWSVLDPCWDTHAGTPCCCTSGCTRLLSVPWKPPLCAPFPGPCMENFGTDRDNFNGESCHFWPLEPNNGGLVLAQDSKNPTLVCSNCLHRGPRYRYNGHHNNQVNSK